jgi:predicted amino acid dehydrogenase
MRKYDEDEILIFAGKFADEFVWTLPISQQSDALRNRIADRAEVVMKDWDGSPRVPLPEELLDRMRAVAKQVVEDSRRAREASENVVSGRSYPVRLSDPPVKVF